MNRFLLLLLVFPAAVFAGNKDPLEACWDKQIAPLQAKFIKVDFSEKYYRLQVDQIPIVADYERNEGDVTVNTNTTTYRSETREFVACIYDTAAFVYDNYRDTSFLPEKKLMAWRIEAANITPLPVIHYFMSLCKEYKTYKEGNLTVIEDLARDYRLKMYINRKHLVEKIHYINATDLMGDVTIVIFYKNYTAVQNVPYPRQIIIEKLEGLLYDTISVTGARLMRYNPALAPIPATYNSKSALPQPNQREVVVKHYLSHIHLLVTGHREQAMVAEFDSFLLVAEAPDNPEEAEAVIKAARNIAPTKPIRYFIVGETRSTNMGFLRSFVHAGATILCFRKDVAFMEMIVNAPHALKPDSLYIDPKPFKYQVIDQDLLITDSNFKMHVYRLDTSVYQTERHFFYYFPAEKLIFEDAMVSIKKDYKGEERAAYFTERVLYDTVRKLGIPVDTIVQSHFGDGTIKTVIPFSDLWPLMKIHVDY